MADKCRNEGCGMFDLGRIGKCSIHAYPHLTTCQNFTTTPTQSITVEELDGLRVRSTRAIISNATYNSAVLGRKEFRKLYREVQAENKRLAELLQCSGVQLCYRVIACDCSVLCRDCNDNNKLADKITVHLKSKEVADG